MLEIEIPMPPLSINHTHISLKRGGRIKTVQTRKYEEEFSTYLLSKYSEDIKEYLLCFNPDLDGIDVSYYFYFPYETYFTKKNRLNLKRLPDVDNMIKLTQDLIFGPFLNDAHIISLRAMKLPYEGSAYIKAIIGITPLPKD